MSAKRTAVLGALLLVASCAPGPSAPPVAPPYRSAAGDAEIRALLLDAAASGALCSKLVDRFVGLPSQAPAMVSADGTTPIDGRWWIRSCSATAGGGSLRLHLAGPGWTYVDEERSGFRVQQYVHFAAEVGLGGTVDVGYDPTVRLASIWFTPVAAGQVHVEPTGPVVAHPMTLFAEVVDAFTLGSVPNAEAREAVESEGALRFRDRLAQGVTLTLDLGRNQYDLELGQLPRGVAPRRPLAGGERWWVNERQRLFAGGAHVSGPFDPGSIAVDVVLEQGSSVELVALCVRDVQPLLGAVGQKGPVTLGRAAFFGQELTRLGATTLPLQPSCPWYLVTRSRAAGPVVLALRVRPTTQPAGPTATHAAVVRLTLVSFHIEPRAADGDGWDVGGGAPDPYFRLVHGDYRQLLGGVSADRFDGTVLATAREPLEVTASAPIRIEAYDEDVAVDDPIGTAEITLGDVLHGGELEKSLTLGPTVTGSVRVRIELVATQ